MSLYTFWIFLWTHLFQTLKSRVEDDPADEAAIEIAKLLFDQAALRSGYQLKDPTDFADRIMNIMYANLDIDPETPVSLKFLYNRKSKKNFSTYFYWLFQLEEEPQAAEFEDENDILEDEEEVDADEEEVVEDGEYASDEKDEL